MDALRKKLEDARRELLNGLREPITSNGAAAVFRTPISTPVVRQLSTSRTGRVSSTLVEATRSPSTRSRTSAILDDATSRLSTLNIGGSRRSATPATPARYSSTSSSHSRRTHFSKLSVNPTAKDMIQTDSMAGLKKNKTIGAYTSEEEYLDVQFRLLREDMIRGLRKGITELRGSQALQARPNNDRNLSVKAVYRNLKITYPTFGLDGINFFVTLDMDQSLSRRLLQGSTKNLMTGSLLCLSNDGFRCNYLFATVAEYDLKQLRMWQGFLISFLPESLEVYRRMGNKVGPFIAVESEAYMEAYVHVLSRLQNMYKETFPMGKYIVSCKTEISKPECLKIPDWTAKYEIFTAAGNWKKVSSLDRIAPSELGFNRSQCQAYLAALTQELSIIQGPPGTGKTYVGLKIIRTILHNLYSRQGGLYDDTRSPILVVCYTNHALDQFLEGILEFCCKDDVVRIGGGSKSEKMKQCTLREHRSKTPKYLSRQYGALMREKEDIERKYNLGAIKSGLQRASRVILKLDDLSITQSSILRQLQRLDVKLIREQAAAAANDEEGKHHTGSALELWLECDPDNFLQKHALKQTGVEEMLLEDQAATIDMKTEAEIELEKRLINVDGFASREKNKWKGRRGHRQEEEEDGFQTVGLSKQHKNQLRRHVLSKLKSDDMMTAEEVEKIEVRRRDIMTLSLDDRWRMYRYWVNNFKSRVSQEVWLAVEEYKRAMESIAQLKIEMNIAMMRQCKVVGMTTTGAAKYQSSIQEIQPPVVIAEEAAEVLEAHITTALSKGCQQLILIGDHKQLKPSTTDYELEKDYDLNLSMFERLVNNKLPLTTLNTQHRMRPEISKFMRHIYDPLHDSDSVRGREPIRGITKSVYFLDHEEPESSDANATSRSNPFEAEMIAAFTRYLVQQGYKPEDITIIAMYTRQIYDLRDKMKLDLNGVQITSVDNYQGEENKIVILSLVRSNDQDIAGFVKIENRVCVSLSRAREGMFVFGNFQMFSRKSALWRKIVRTATQEGELGHSLNLCCVKHGKPSQIRKAEDFELYAPNGGCTKPCNEVLKCSHICPLKCHYTHEGYECEEKCRKRHGPCGHLCTLKCYQECGPCRKPTQVILGCGHPKNVPCHKSRGDIEDMECSEPCPETLRCGHQCQERCSATCTNKCLFPVQKKCAHCQNNNVMPCRTARILSLLGGFVCKQPCTKVCRCGHPCTKDCSECKLSTHSVCGRTSCPTSHSVMLEPYAGDW